jgi:3',5'-cyclic AMP phosphodiesterase CpdA
MDLKIFKKILFFLLFFVVSCNYTDLTGFLFSSYVNERFKIKDDLKNFSPPAVSDPDNFSFLVVADSHYAEKQLDFFKKIQEKKDEWGISFVVILGDITYAGQRGEYDFAIEDFLKCTIPIYPVLGNHDLYNNGFDIYKDKIGRTVYDFKVGRTHCIILDTANGTIGSLQKKWLENVLKSSGADNILIFSHYSPTDSEFVSYTEWSFPEEKYYLIDLLDDYNADYFFCGHLHFNDEKEIRGVKYVIVKDLYSGTNDVFLKVTVNSSGVTASLL